MMRHSFSLIELLIFTMILTIIIMALEPINQTLSKTAQLNHHQKITLKVANALSSNDPNPILSYENYTITYETTPLADHTRIKATIFEHGVPISSLEYLRVSTP
jgi:Tfp pilus assembly protein PilV